MSFDPHTQMNRHHNRAPVNFIRRRMNLGQRPMAAFDQPVPMIFAQGGQMNPYQPAAMGAGGLRAPMNPRHVAGGYRRMNRAQQPMRPHHGPLVPHHQHPQLMPSPFPLMASGPLQSNQSMINGYSVRPNHVRPANMPIQARFPVEQNIDTGFNHYVECFDVRDNASLSPPHSPPQVPPPSSNTEQDHIDVDISSNEEDDRFVIDEDEIMFPLGSISQAEREFTEFFRKTFKVENVSQHRRQQIKDNCRIILEHDALVKSVMAASVNEDIEEAINTCLM